MAITTSLAQGKLEQWLPAGFDVEHDVMRQQFIIRYREPHDPTFLTIYHTIDEESIYRHRNDEGFVGYVVHRMMSEYEANKREKSTLTYEPATVNNFIKPLHDFNTPRLKRTDSAEDGKKVMLAQRFKQVKEQNEPVLIAPKDSPDWDF